MSVVLYPDHKAILHFYDSLKVYEIDLLSHLTNLLGQDQYAQRRFEIYVKPTLGHSLFDFIIVEPNQSIYIIQTPRDKKQYRTQKEAYDDFFHSKSHKLSPTLKQNIEIMGEESGFEKLHQVIKQVYYIFEKDLFESLKKVEKLITPKDFEENTDFVQDIFMEHTKDDYSLTGKETTEIREILNPNTNLQNYVPKTLAPENELKAKSTFQGKQKFKGEAKAGKTTLLIQRIINCANRLNGKGKILVVAGKAKQKKKLKELITAEDGRSLQELGIGIFGYEELSPPVEKYNALFIDDAHCLKKDWLNDLLDNYLVELNKENDYEYVVMTDDENLPKVPQIFGRFSTIDKQYQEISSMLSESRKIFLDILER